MKKKPLLFTKEKCSLKNGIVLQFPKLPKWHPLTKDSWVIILFQNVLFWMKCMKKTQFHTDIQLEK